jgi:hypothetical protein
MALELQFPFVEVSQIEVAFGGIPNYKEVVEACPKEFYDSNGWSNAAMRIFSNGMSEKDAEQVEFKTDDVEVAKAQFAYMQAWLGSFSPPHEVKRAVCGWLLSEMLTGCPQFS